LTTLSNDAENFGGLMTEVRIINQRAASEFNDQENGNLWMTPLLPW
jgi:hypothetical protein